MTKRDLRTDPVTKPPAATRRDDRAEPDDDNGGRRVERVDVVNVEGTGSRDTTASAVMSLRRELARLTQQATAVERSLEDQRRDRGDAIDKLEKATERVLSLEARLSAIEAESVSLRRLNENARSDLARVCEERDDLQRAVENAKQSTSELGRLRDELDSAKADVTRLENELVETKKAHAADASRVGAKEGELGDLIAKLTRAQSELDDAKRDAERREAAISGLRSELTEAREAAARVRDEADRDRLASREQTERLERLLAEAALDKEARAETERLRAELEKAQAAIASADTRAAEADARAKRAEDRASETEERAKQIEARAAEAAKDAESRISAAEDRAKQAEAKANEADVLARQAQVVADAAEDRAKQADARAASADQRAKESDELTAAAEARAAAADAAATAAESRESAAVSRATVMEMRVQGAEADAASAEERLKGAEAAYTSLERSMRRLRDEIAFAFERAGLVAPISKAPPPAPDIVSIPPEMAQSVPPSAAPPPLPRAAPPPLPPQLVLDSLDDEWSSSSSGSNQEGESIAPASPVSKSVPPPPSSIETPHHQIGAPPVPLPSGASVRPSVPEVAAQRPSQAPTLATETDDPEPLKTNGIGTSPPPTRRFDESVVPGAEPTRDDIVAMLLDPDAAPIAAITLRERPEWLRSLPPPELVTALSSVDYDAEGPVFEVARAWEREPLCHALLAQLRSEKEARIREHGAWLLKHFAAPGMWKPIADIARDDDEPVQVRRWLLEALDRLVSAHAIGWREIGDLVTAMVHHANSSLRDAIVGILSSLERSEEKKRLLLDILGKDDDEIVLSGAVHALASVLPVELDPVVVERLLGHPSGRVQRSVRDLVEQAKKETRT